ncbi:MAG: hypothetical protein ACYDAG_08705 [Chloroflexota bacterium]
MSRIDWRENFMKFFKKRVAIPTMVTLIGPGGDPDVKRLENYFERMNLEFDEIDTREEPLPEGFIWADQPIVVVNGEAYPKAKPQEMAQVVGLALRHYGFDETDQESDQPDHFAGTAGKLSADPHRAASG